MTLHFMSDKELSRLEILRDLSSGRLTVLAAAELLGLERRQVLRLAKAYKNDCATALISKKRGRPSNRQSSSALKDKVLTLVREHADDMSDEFKADAARAAGLDKSSGAPITGTPAHLGLREVSHREQRARLEKHQLLVVIAKGFFRFQVQVHLGAFFMALQRLLDLGEQVGPADQKLDRIIQDVQCFTQSVLERPREGDDALRCDFHRRIVAACAQFTQCPPHNHFPCLAA